ncbi:MAG TPA: hypothetical protein VLJ59_16645 [Mycobacteriales bacterium]|nr:hypothetical protein [Mycobacteriales bacterium]
MPSQLDKYPIRTATLPPAVFRHWRHSQEEDRDGVEVYHTDDFPFPPAFGRDGFEICSDGRFVQEDIGPADEIIRTPGHWALLAPRRVGVSLDGGTGTPRRFVFDIVDVDDSTLRIRRFTRHAGPTEAGEGAADEARAVDLLARPPASTFRLIDFEEAKILSLLTFPGQFVLQVSGLKPYADMKVSLEPVVYIRQPEYWEIEVVGSLSGIGLPVDTPYTVSLPLAGSIGSIGIDVVGATTFQRFDILPGNTQ